MLCPAEVCKLAKNGEQTGKGSCRAHRHTSNSSSLTIVSSHGNKVHLQRVELNSINSAVLSASLLSGTGLALL